MIVRLVVEQNEQLLETKYKAFHIQQYIIVSSSGRWMVCFFFLKVVHFVPQPSAQASNFFYDDVIKCGNIF